jgi:hypothetical protein
MKYPRAVFAAAAIVFGTTVALMLQDGPGGCCTRAHAQTQTAPPAPATEPSTEPSIWDHNGSMMYLVENGASREFHYQKPRPGMLEAGAHSGSLLFRGRIDNGQYSGTAYIFNPQCGPIPFQVTGTARDNGDGIMLTGQAPLVGRNCRISGSFTSNLEFRRLNPAAAMPSQQPLAGAAAPPDVEPSRSQAPSAVAAENTASQLAAPIASPEKATAPPAVTGAAPAAPKEIDNFIWAALIIAVVLVIGAAAMLAAN